MKKIIPLFTFFFIVSFSFAQDHYVSLSMGASVPLGTYSGETSSTTTGYALPSFTLSFDGNYFFAPYLGISATANYGMNGVSEEELKTDVILHLQDLYPDFTLPPDAEVSFITTQWTYVNLFVGPVVSVPIASFNFQLRALAGMSFTMPPKRDLFITYTNTELNHHAEGQSLKFGYLLGAAILYQPNRNYGLRLAADYFSTNSVIDIDHRYDDGSGGEEIITEKAEIPVTAMHITLGIVTFF